VSAVLCPGIRGCVLSFLPPPPCCYWPLQGTHPLGKYTGTNPPPSSTSPLRPPPPPTHTRTHTHSGIPPRLRAPATMTFSAVGALLPLLLLATAAAALSANEEAVAACKTLNFTLKAQLMRGFGRIDGYSRNSVRLFYMACQSAQLCVRVYVRLTSLFPVAPAAIPPVWPLPAAIPSEWLLAAIPPVWPLLQSLRVALAAIPPCGPCCNTSVP